MSDSKSSKEKTSDTIKTVLGFIGGAILVFFAYLWFINSHQFEGNFFGLTFRMPFESVEHYCSRKSDQVFTVDVKGYQECVESNGSTHQRLKAKIDNTMKSEGVNSSDKQLECAAGIFERYLSPDEIVKYLNGEQIPQSTSTYDKMMDGFYACYGQSK